MNLTWAFAESNASSELDKMVCMERPYSAFQAIIYVPLMLPLCLVGLLGNVVSLRVFSPKYLPLKEYRPYVDATCGSDSVILISSFFLFTLPVVSQYALTHWNCDMTYVSLKLLVFCYPIAQTARTLSTWFSVMISVTRLISLRFPTFLCGACVPKKASGSIAVVTFVGCLYNMPRFFEVDIVRCLRRGLSASYQMRRSELRMNYTYKTVYLGWMYTVALVAIPLLIVCMTNVTFSLKDYRQRRGLKEASGRRVLGQQLKLAQDYVASEVLLFIGREFLFCNILPCINNVLELLLDNEAVSLTYDVHQAYEVLVPLANLMVVLNASCNALIYVWFTRRYVENVAADLFGELREIDYTTKLILTAKHNSPAQESEKCYGTLSKSQSESQTMLIGALEDCRYSSD